MLRALFLVPLLVVLAACSNGATSRPPAATVSGTPITTDQLAATAGVFKAVAGLQQQPCGQTDGETDTQDAACNRFSLGALITFRAADAYATANDVTVTDDQVTKAFDAFQKNVGADQLTSQLTANNVTNDDVRELIRLSLVQEAVAKDLAAPMTTDAKLRKQYESSIGDYTQLHVDHILLDSEKQANAIYDQVTAPGYTLEDFQALAKKVSTDPNAPQDGGELTQPASQLVEEFSAAAETLKPGEISKPVQTQFGWHVIWMIDKQVTPFDQAKTQIVQTAATKAFQGWLHDQASQVQVDPSFGRYDGEQLQVVRISSTDPSATEAAPSSPVNAAPSTP
jgi:parvulin-like peptidyl-prolyl isomerase